MPPHVPAVNAASCLPRVIKKDDEVIIRDRATNKVLLAVYRNRIGSNVLKHMRSTIVEMFNLHRQVARSAEIKELDQGALTAAGYILVYV